MSEKSNIIMNLYRSVKFLVARETLVIFLTVLLLILLIFPFKLALPYFSSYLLGTHSDFTTYFIYLSDVIIIGLSLYFLLTKRSLTTYLAILAMILIPLLWPLISRSSEYWLSVYVGTRLTLSLFLGISLTNSNYWLKYKRLFLSTLIILAVLQSLVALVQFALQSDLGLNLIGESTLQINQFGVAKFVAYGTTFIRTYGTFPHPNILSAILVIISLLNLYLLNISQQSLQKLALISSYFLISVGIALTFSRGGVIALLLGTIALAGISFIQTKGIHWKNYGIVLASWFLIGLIFYPSYTSRATISDSAVIERTIYNQVAIKIIGQEPITGLGAGQSLLHMQQFSSVPLEPWQIQPIHNYYLVWLSEWGIAGWIFLISILLLIYLFFKKIFFIRQKNLSQDKLWQGTLGGIIVAVLFLFTIDHYFYTNWSMQIFLAMILGLIYLEIKTDSTESA